MATPELVIFQLAPSLITVKISFESLSNHDEVPSIVCDEVVAIVSTGKGLVVLAFFMEYTRPAQPAASGNVSVAAEVPVNNNVLSVDAAVVEAVKDR